MKRPNYRQENAVSTTVMDVDPGLAAKWLEGFNDRNRPLLEAKARGYAADMKAGRWEFNGEAIIFAEDGHLSDGQHRLWAVVLSETSQRFVIVEGTSRRSQATVDLGQARSAKHQLAVLGTEVSNSMAAAIRVYIQWQTGRLFGDNRDKKVSTPQIVQWAEGNHERVEVLRRLEATTGRASFVAPRVIMAVGLALHEIDADDAADFLGRLVSGTGLEAGSPILALRNRLQKVRVDRLMVPERDLIGAFVQAWNAYRDQRPILKIQRPRGASFSPDTFPVPH